MVAANRDEHYDRPSASPRLLGNEPKILAGQDLRVGGTWLGVNEHGLLAGILNRKSAAGQNAREQYRSRGLLCLDLLKCSNLGEAGALLVSQAQVRYQPFTLVFADEGEAWVAHNGAAGIRRVQLGVGLHVFSNTAEFDGQSEKRTRAYGRFTGLIDTLRQCSGRSLDKVSALAEVLKDHTLGKSSNGPNEALCVHGEASGTVSSSIIFYSGVAREFQHFFNAAPPCQAPFSPGPTLAVR